MRNHRVGGALSAFVMFLSPAALWPWSPSTGAKYRVEASTGALSWVLTAGRVPGDLPLEVVYRHQGNQGTLHFGFIAPALGGRPGRQVLEDGRSFVDTDWQPSPPAGSALAQAYGFTIPPGSLAMDPARTLGSCDADPRDLGHWGAEVGTLTPASVLKVILDHQRARIYAYQDALKVFVPVLWIDRFGHAIRFRWLEERRGPESFLILLATNPQSRGIQAVWAMGGPPDSEVDLLRAEFIGMQGPPLLVRGHPATPSTDPFASGRPVRVSLGEAAALREWTFGYEDNGVPVLRTLRSPQGLATTFTWGEGRYPDGTSLLGVTRSVDLDVGTGTVFEQTWRRDPPGGETWTVSHTAAYSDGEATEDRRTEYTFSATVANPFLRSERIAGSSGTERMTILDPLLPGDDGRCLPAGIHVTASGRPTMDVLRAIDPSTRRLLTETLVVGGEQVQIRTMEPASALPGEPPCSVVTARAGLPLVVERWIRSPQGALTRHSLLAGGQERGGSFTTDPEGRRTRSQMVASWTPDPGMIRTWEQGPLGPIGLITSGERLAEPLREAWSYTDRGQVAEYTDARGNATSYTYDMWGRLLNVKAPGMPELTYAYPDEQTRTWTQGRLNGLEAVDGFGRLQSRLRGDGVKETFSFDTMGRVVSVQESVGKTTRLVRSVAYDALDRIRLDRSPHGTDPILNYRAEGTSQVVEIGSGLTLAFDPWGRIVSRTDVEGTTRATYNEFGQTTRLIRQEPGGLIQTRQFTFDGIGNLTAIAEPETGTTVFADFNARGQSGLETNAAGRSIRRVFDALGRVVEAQSGGQRLAATYRGPFLMGRESPDGVSQRFTYSAPGARMDSETIVLGGVERTTRFAYDSNGGIGRMTYPGGRVVEYGYDGLDRVAKVIHDGALLASVAYDGWGNRTRLGFASGAASSWKWEGEGRRWLGWEVSHLGGVESRSYAWDGMELASAGEWMLRNDSAGRLQEAVGLGLHTFHESDGFGNAISHQVSGVPPAAFNGFAFAPLPANRMPGIQPNGALTGWVVEPSGEPSQMGTGTGSRRCLNLAWDGFGRLAEVAGSQSGGVQRYRYSPQGLMAVFSDSADHGADRQFVYLNDGRLLSEYFGDGRWGRDILYLGEEALAEVDRGGVHELHSDHLGTPRIVTSGSTGTIEGRQDFGPWGETLEASPGYTPLTGYTGHLRTEASGLICMRARFYSPAWHRFLTPDRGVDPRSWNSFAYAAGRPFQVTDPTGMAGGKPPFAGSATVTVWGNLEPIPYHVGPIPCDRPIPFMGIPGPMFVPNVPSGPPFPTGEGLPDAGQPAAVGGGGGPRPDGMTCAEFERWSHDPNNIYSAVYQRKGSLRLPPPLPEAVAWEKAKAEEAKRKADQKAFEETVFKLRLQQALETQGNPQSLVKAADRELQEALRKQGSEIMRTMRITRTLALADAQKGIQGTPESRTEEITRLVNAERAGEGLPSGRVNVQIHHITGNTAWGHLVIKVGEGQALGLIPDSTLDSAVALAKEGLGVALTGLPSSSLAGGRVVPMNPKENLISTATMRITHEEALVMVKFMEKAVLVPQVYHPIVRNCVEWVKEVLNIAGIQAPLVVTPEEMVKLLNRKYPGK
ncbi:RHS repeat domain-containing protein [Geothrix sp. 21YS21S-2]|uniref:RHS repeat domain-containing protein n=1 Tax=Geothrix sp. 21YS21S-2 TaxID=3068893 RepID=UPI0027BB1584|nr:RHS repeat-associated core domain-containing protein [Geothrix sp. 21YS21S-2]